MCAKDSRHPSYEKTQFEMAPLIRLACLGEGGRVRGKGRFLLKIERGGGT